MTTNEKTKVMLGEAYTAPVFVEKKALVNGKEVTAIEDGEEILTLRPIPIKYWSELEKTKINDLPTKLIYLTCRKSQEWVEEFLNPSCFCDLYQKCKEVNHGFFDQLDLLAALIQENQKKTAEFQAKSEALQSTASENISQMPPTA